MYNGDTGKNTTAATTTYKCSQIFEQLMTALGTSSSFFDAKAAIRKMSNACVDVCSHACGLSSAQSLVLSLPNRITLMPGFDCSSITQPQDQAHLNAIPFQLGCDEMSFQVDFMSACTDGFAHCTFVFTTVKNGVNGSSTFQQTTQPPS